MLIEIKGQKIPIENTRPRIGLLYGEEVNIYTSLDRRENTDGMSIKDHNGRMFIEDVDTPVFISDKCEINKDPESGRFYLSPKVEE